MKKLSFLASLLVLCLPMAAAAQEDAPKAEIFGGYSLLRIDNDGEAFNMHGFNASLAGNITKHLGIVGELSRLSKSFSINDPVVGQVDSDLSVLTYLFGPRITLHRGKAEPFVHALLGGGRSSIEAFGFSRTEKSFAYALGGGLDVKVSDNFAIRLAQLDVLGTRFDDESAHDLRYSVGIVIRLGKR